jgi:outer membrane receptor protein involved in Fe transport
VGTDACEAVSRQPSAVSTPESAVIAWICVALAQEGELVGIVFDAAGSPVAGAPVSVGSVATVSDEGGAWRLAVPAGAATLHVADASIEVPVVAGRTTEVLVTLGGTVTIEAPPAAEVVEERPTGPPGSLEGTVVDGDTGEPLGGVRVFVRGSDADATSDARGRFRLTLPSGGWDLSAVRAGYATEAATVEVVASEDRPVALKLVKAGLSLGDVTVKAPRIAGAASSVLDERKEAAGVSDVLGAEQMSRSGDSDAAAALRRVTGLTVIGGKYVYVRGLGDRYSATLLNGSMLPSPEPEKRVVPLDLFPTSLLEAVVVQKTFSPDRPAEFGGGIVEVRTKRIPEEPLLSMSVSGSYVSGTTGVTSPYLQSGPTDWAGFGKGFRALPEELAAASEEEAIKPGGIFSDGGYSAEELEHFGELVPNRWGLRDRALAPDFGVSASAGRRWQLGGVEVGGLGGLVFSNGWSLDEGTRTVYSNTGDGELEAKRITDFVETENRVRLGGALSLGAEWGEHGRVTSTTLLMRSSTGSAESYDADDPTGSNDTHSVRIAWEEQQLLFEQVEASVPAGPVLAEARYALGIATRAAPDGREYTYLATDDGLVVSQRGSWSEILYEDLHDTTHDVGLDLTLPIGEAKAKAGGQMMVRARESTTRRFGYEFQGSEGIDLSADIEDIITADNIGAEGEDDPGYLELEENTSSSDDYTAGQRLVAGYLMGDVPWTPRIRTLAGARVESSAQSVSTFELFDTSNEPVEASLETLDVLPAATVTFGVGADPDAMLVRLGYGRTVSRPELRELTEVSYYDYRTGRLLYGNPDLERATIENVDVRWEWYPRAGESVSIGGFFKYFDHPIESVVAVSAVSGSVGTFDNATSATNWGAELDVRQRLDVVSELLRDVYVSGNASLVRSRVDLSDTEGNQTSDERPLQGQSPWVVNAQLGYENPDSRTNVALLYNVFGPRIVEVGTSGIPDTYEEPVHRVDLVVSQGIGEHWAVRAKGANLLDWPVRETTGGVVSEETRDGWSAGLSLTWTPS